VGKNRADRTRGRQGIKGDQQKFEACIEIHAVIQRGKVSGILSLMGKKGGRIGGTRDFPLTRRKWRMMSVKTRQSGKNTERVYANKIT